MKSHQGLIFFLFLASFFGIPSSVFALKVESSAFKEQEKIPPQYTCDGENVSPPLVWSEIPKGTQSLALVVDDPDAPAGTWVHWVVYNILPATNQLEEGIPKAGKLPNGVTQGDSDFKTVGYGGPCPPSGPVHRYSFKLYALDTVPQLPPHSTKADLLVAATGHILAQTELVGTYQK